MEMKSYRRVSLNKQALISSFHNRKPKLVHSHDKFHHLEGAKKAVASQKVN